LPVEKIEMRFKRKCGGSIRNRCSSLFLEIVLGGALLSLAGCGFFPPQTNNGGSNGGGSTTPTNTGDYLYVGNAGNVDIAGFSVGTTGALSILTNSPYNNGVAVASLAVTPNNAFLYAGTTGGIFAYLINSNGSLSIQNNGTALAQDVIPTIMQVDATGTYLLATGLGVTAQAQALGIYQINSSTGALTALTGSPLPLFTGSASTPSVLSPTGLLITPNNSIVYVSLGTLGVQVLTLGSGGALSAGNSATVLPPSSKSTAPADYGLASDPNSKFLFVAEFNTGLRVLSIGTNGALSEISGSPYTAGTGPTGVIVDPTGSYVYVANKGSNNISAYTLNASSGVLTTISGSPFSSGGQLPIAFANDNSKKYLATINSGNNGSGGNNDLQLFSYSTATPGALTAVSNATTGTDPANPQSIAATAP
jgi:6-phosphogluconolactonase